MPQQIPSKRCHWLDVPSRDFIQIFKLLQRTQESTSSNLNSVTRHFPAGLITKHMEKHESVLSQRWEENSLLHYWSRVCAPSWMHSLCLPLSRPHADRYHQPPTKHPTGWGWDCDSVSDCVICFEMILILIHPSRCIRRNFFIALSLLFLTFQVTVRWFSPLLLGLMIKSPWSRVSIIFSAWLKLILWKLGWAITRFIYAGETVGTQETWWCGGKYNWVNNVHYEEKQQRAPIDWLWFYKSFTILTCSLLFLFQLLLVFLILRLSVKIIVAVLGELPLIGLVHQIRSAACQVNAEFLDVDFHDAAVNGHAHL